MRQSTPAPAVRPPGKAEASWYEKARVAVQAREMSKVIRKGKPTSFRPAVGRTR